jgi:L-iditol 2-dehydrogenase
MIAASYTQGGAFEITEAPKPSIGSEEILLRVEATSICGTDVKIIRNGHRKLKAGQRIVLGHEFAGSIEEMGSKVEGFKIGQRIGIAPNWGCGSCEACRRGRSNYCADFSAFGINADGSHAEWIKIPEAVIRQSNITILPEKISWEEASLTEPLSCVLGGQEAITLGEGDSVLIYGMGPMGLLHVLAAKAAGAKTIMAVDLKRERLDMAKKLGATHAVQSRVENVPERVAEWTKGSGPDAVITAVSAPEVVSEAFALLGTFGRLCLFAGLPKDRSSIPLDGNMIHYRSITVTGTTGGSNSNYRQAIDLIATGKIDVKEIITHRFSFEQLPRAYETALAGKGMKIVIRHTV